MFSFYNIYFKKCPSWLSIQFDQNDYQGDWSPEKDKRFDNLYGSLLQSQVITFSQLKIQKALWAIPLVYGYSSRFLIYY